MTDALPSAAPFTLSHMSEYHCSSFGSFICSFLLSSGLLHPPLRAQGSFHTVRLLFLSIVNTGPALCAESRTQARFVLSWKRQHHVFLHISDVWRKKRPASLNMTAICELLQGGE
ncbi:hypothetical protein AMECASPLE_020470 [Ameca splendens]|uniref:Uncharacterized protein n=1 Tax=Ameca splendens TaxID=208324 RepID=A0ABV0ZC51_9TELE